MSYAPSAPEWVLRYPNWILGVTKEVIWVLWSMVDIETQRNFKPGDVAFVYIPQRPGMTPAETLQAHIFERTGFKSIEAVRKHLIKAKKLGFLDWRGAGVTLYVKPYASETTAQESTEDRRATHDAQDSVREQYRNGTDTVPNRYCHSTETVLPQCQIGTATVPNRYCHSTETVLPQCQISTATVPKRYCIIELPKNPSTHLLNSEGARSSESDPEACATDAKNPNPKGPPQGPRSASAAQRSTTPSSTDPRPTDANPHLTAEALARHRQITAAQCPPPTPRATATPQLPQELADALASWPRRDRWYIELENPRWLGWLAEAAGQLRIDGATVVAVLNEHDRERRKLDEEGRLREAENRCQFPRRNALWWSWGNEGKGARAWVHATLERIEKRRSVVTRKRDPATIDPCSPEWAEMEAERQRNKKQRRRELLEWAARERQREQASEASGSPPRRDH
ncbi:MAG: hypothetical protein M0R28_17950 [Pigmentiphaga sp.]|nr:hypothetical protein [Pigmentiphaga sp.]